MGMRGQLAATLILGMALFAVEANAQDTSLMDMNMNMGCMLMAGMHEMQVAVYPAGATDDACPDLPYPGQTVVTLTSAAKEFRDMSAEVRIIHGEAGAEKGAAVDQVTVAHLPAKTYPTGVITLPANFDKPGLYSVLVTVSDGKEMTMSGHVNITVGQGSRQWYIVLAIAIAIILAASWYYFWDVGRKKKKLAPTA